MPKVLVCPVAYNENVKLRSAIERFLKSPARGRADYLIVDDCSTDGTTEMIRSFADRGVGTIRHGRRSGVGAAIRTAVKHALSSGYDVLVIMAGNDKDNPDEIPALLAPILDENCDIVQGSRYIGGNRVGGDMPYYRKLATRLHPFLMSLVARRRVTDSTNGFRAMRTAVFRDARVNIDQDWLDAYELEPYILFKAITLGYRFREVPVTKIYPPRKLGYTKMRPILGWWSILRPLVYLGLGIKK
ncbi:MAG: glycosyltransferase family 2 protein [Candidatus Omnitrophota bacterium]|nr:glycosyltransferase family 2 protein [Candidatus Omnitrophota bacterium]MDZ4241461.1 glycosyltransferase family 2 protein [Candidatus Omnitrophota bacterium]